MDTGQANTHPRYGVERWQVGAMQSADTAVLDGGVG